MHDEVETYERPRVIVMQRLKVLIIDQNHAWRAHLTEVLTELGHEVEVVPNAMLAARSMMAASPDVIVLDEEIPGGVARQILIWIEKSGHEEVPILVLESERDTADLETVLSLGACGIVSRDARPEQWYVRLREAVSQGAERDWTPTVETSALMP